ncbi:MAG: cation transporter [Treponema sp.]|nr:cation transporter [Treponema sp.]
MITTILEIDGMACSMCESHINDVIRNTFAVKKVKSSYKKGRSEIKSVEALDEDAVRKAISATGYTVKNMTVSGV